MQGLNGEWRGVCYDLRMEMEVKESEVKWVYNLV